MLIRKHFSQKYDPPKRYVVLGTLGKAQVRHN